MKKILLFLTVISFNLCSYAGYVKINAQNYNLHANSTFAINSLSQEFIAAVSAKDAPNLSYDKIVITKTDVYFNPIQSAVFFIEPDAQIIVHDIIVKEDPKSSFGTIILLCGEINGKAFVFKVDYDLDPSTTEFYKYNSETVFYSIEAIIDLNKIIVCGRDNNGNGIISSLEYSNMTNPHQILPFSGYEFHKVTWLYDEQFVVSGIHREEQKCGFICVDINNLNNNSGLYWFQQSTTPDSYCVTTPDPNNPYQFYVAYSDNDIIYSFLADNSGVLSNVNEIHYQGVLHLKDIACFPDRFGFVGYESSNAVGPLANASFLVTCDLAFNNLMYFENYVQGVQHELHKIKVFNNLFYCGGVWDDVETGITHNVARFFFVYENLTEDCHRIEYPDYNQSNININVDLSDYYENDCSSIDVEGEEIESFITDQCDNPIDPFNAKSFNSLLNIEKASVKENNIFLSPNPANDWIEVRLNGKVLNNGKIEIYNLQGKLLFMQDIVDETTSIDISSYAEGMYLFKIQNNQQHIKTLKVIINR
ncbi:MAG: T9SS type A sorting domain-containing protein [Bacteroidales bacterium]|nr:T9SS type A sorting domain-containing protein [Bacteroidales bacterium]